MCKNDGTEYDNLLYVLVEQQIIRCNSIKLKRAMYDGQTIQMYFQEYLDYVQRAMYLHR